MKIPSKLVLLPLVVHSITAVATCGKPKEKKLLPSILTSLMSPIKQLSNRGSQSSQNRGHIVIPGMFGGQTAKPSKSKDSNGSNLNPKP